MNSGLVCNKCGNEDTMKITLTDIGNDRYNFKCDICSYEKTVKFVPKNKEHAVVTKAKVWHRDLTEQEMIDAYNGKDVKCNCVECKPKGL